MGTKSKKGWNYLCRVRGPIAGVILAEDVLAVLLRPKQYTRLQRRRAKSLLRHAAGFIRTNISTKSRNATEKNVLKMHQFASRRHAV